MHRIALLLIALLVATAVAADDRPSLQAILARVSDYVVRYENTIQGIVAEEHYVQDSDKADRPFVTHRELKSDLLLVRADGPNFGYVQFRDVFEVDGDAVRDRSDRLTKLFLNPSLSSRRQAAELMNESSRYNIGSIERNVNVPLVALMLLDPMYQMRFKYSVSSERKGTPRGLPKSPAFTLAADAWEIDFEEVVTPTVIRGDDYQDAKSHGRIWVDPDTSQVLLTELVVEAKTVRSTFRVSFRSEPVAGLPVPVEMRETYTAKKRFYTLEGTATYSNFRQFSVTTVESVGEPASQR
jgi:outer membrane lipoprotein-sorting protein